MYCCAVSLIAGDPPLPFENLSRTVPEHTLADRDVFFQTATKLADTDPRAYCPERSSVRRGRNSNSVGCIFSRASSTEKNAARSISGNSRVLPERGGHSISKVLLRRTAGSQSPSKAQAVTFFPLLCLTLPKGRNGDTGCSPVSS